MGFIFLVESFWTRFFRSRRPFARAAVWVGFAVCVHTMYVYIPKGLDVLWRLTLVVIALQVLMAVLAFVWLSYGLVGGLIIYLAAVVPPVWLPLLVLAGPVIFIFLAEVFRHSVRNEALLVQMVGPERALWHTVPDSWGYFVSTNISKHGMRALVWKGEDLSGPILEASARALNLPQELQDQIGEGIVSLSSRAWSWMIVQIDSLNDDKWGPWLTVVAFYWVTSRYVSSAGFAVGRRAARNLMVIVLVLWYVPGATAFEWLFWAINSTLTMTVALTTGHIPLVLEWAMWRFSALTVFFVGWAHAVNSEFDRKFSNRLASNKNVTVFNAKVVIMKAVAFVSDINLPGFIRSRGVKSPSLQAIKESNDIMASLGWPVNVTVGEEAAPVEGYDLSSIREWIIGGSDFATGIRNTKVIVDRDLDMMRGLVAEYKRSESYASEKNELEATSRYFNKVEYTYPELELDEVWEVVGDIFRISHITPFRRIIHLWEKKYALGAFMRDPSQPWRKYKRSSFINDVSMPVFKKMWAATFYHASRIIPVAHVSVKGEALPEKKWLNDKIRTIIGSPLSQYILSTPWNFGPNHTFKWETTPIKVGMPLNGFWLTRLWQRHSRAQIHVEGDFTAFDSTVSGRVVDLIKAVRKKGYELHKDRERISDLIDINYEYVRSQPLNTTTTGNIYAKGTGLSTGHSATSMDNSVAIVVLYLMAWKDLTGLSAREFLHFNELSNYGDDHILSILATKPAVWTPSNISKVMSRWGVRNNLEVKPLSSIQFLSKFGTKTTFVERQQLAQYGLKDCYFKVFHNKEKLLGKLLAPVKSADANYRLRRLLSYLDLCAHHKDVYDQVVNAIESSHALSAALRQSKLKIPTYSNILKQWYVSDKSPTKSDQSFRDELDETMESSKLVEYGAITPLDYVLGTLSIVPDLLSPVFFNYGYVRALQILLGRTLSWVGDFLQVANSTMSDGHLARVASSTPYRFLDFGVLVPGVSDCNYTSMLIRHWVFLLYVSWVPRPSYGGLLNRLAVSVNNAQFALTGLVAYNAKNHDAEIDKMLVLAILSFINVPWDFLKSFRGLVLPNFTVLIDLIWHYVLVTIWSSVPPNYREVTPALRNLTPANSPMGIQAPTATGKSTALVQHMVNMVGHKYHKVVVIEPRALLVEGLVSYMERTFSMNVCGGTHNLRYRSDAKVIYATPQWVFGHPEMFHPRNLFVLDEAHLAEDFYMLFKTCVKSLKVACIYMTATFPEDLRLTLPGPVVEVPIAQVFSVAERQVSGGKFSTASVRTAALDYAATIGPASKALIFLPSVADVLWCVENFRGQSVPLTADNRPLDWSAPVIFANNVADVGVTIPNVDAVWTSNVATQYKETLPSFAGGDTSVPISLLLDEAGRAQRRGRTGRTGNGVFTCVNYTDVPHVRPEATPFFEKHSFLKLLLSGVPPELLRTANSGIFLQSLGVTAPIDDPEKITSIARSATVFLNNLRPLMIQMNSMSSDTTMPSLGPINALESGMTTEPPTKDVIMGHCKNVLLDIVNAVQHDSVELSSSLDSLNFLDLIAGPVKKVSSLVWALLRDPEDGMTDLPNPRNVKDESDFDILMDMFSIINNLS